MSSNLKLDLEDADEGIAQAVAGFAPGTKATITVDVIVNEVSEKMLDARVTSITDIQSEEGGEEMGEDVEVTDEAPPAILLFAGKKDGGSQKGEQS
jgi:hypothetical protein